MKFSHLHNHTQFSLLDGASNIAKLYKKAEADGHPAMAITDHGNMFGVFEFVSQAWKSTKVVGKTEDGKDIKEPTVKPVVGCEFYLVENRLKRAFTKEEGKDRRYHQLFLAKDEIGYKNLVKLCSLGYIEGLYGKYPRIDKELVLKHHEGLIATTCCLGASVPRTILQKGEEAGEQEFKWWLDLFGDDYYVEFQRHDIPDQIKVNEVLVRFAKKYNVPVIASNDSHYVEQTDYNAHDILLCINTGEKQATPKYVDGDDDGGTRDTRFAFYNDQFFFKNTDEMTRLFHDLPQAIDNTNAIVDKIKPLKLERDILLPHFKVPVEFADDQDAYLEHLTWTGAKERYREITPEVEERLKFELFTIRTMGFAGYFLIVADFIKAGRDMGVSVGPGRGSAAGSVVAYCTGITNIDPIKYNLLFERFLNPERKSMPDIDTDFDDAGRQKVIDYVVDKYGKNQVAAIVTYGTMAAKTSIKDVARVMDLPLAESNMLTKLVPEKPGVTMKLARLFHAPLSGEGGLTDKEKISSDDIPNVEQLRAIYAREDDLQGIVLREAEKLEGSVRNTGVHAAGIIIAPSDLTDLVPVAVAKDSSLLVTQYEGRIIENAGVIKMDFLGLKTLSIIKDALELIKLNHGREIDIDGLPLDDADTYALYSRGETNSTFQFESAGMQKALVQLKPDRFDDLIAMNALYRPGPLEYIPNFIRRKHGQEAIEYDLPEMEEYLAETYGITVYQEQVMLLSQKLAGFSKGDADVLRKAMGKKQKEVLDKMKSKFIDGATAKGYATDKLAKIWTDWEAFAQYAFNKSHSTCYALVAYQTAWLKAHYPAEYMAAVLNNQHDIAKIKFHMEECQRMELPVLGPSVNESRKGFSVNNEGVVRFGLNAIKGVGEAAVEDVIAEREKGGEFADVYDLVKRINHRTIGKKTLESLVCAGGMDCFPQLHRAQYFATTPDGSTNIDRLVRFGQQYQDGKTMGASSLFGEEIMADVAPPTLPTCEPWNNSVLLDKEKDMVGIYISAHPLDGFRFEIQHFKFHEIGKMAEMPNKSLRIAAYISDAQHRTAKNGGLYGSFTLNDYTGHCPLFMRGQQYANFKDYIQDGQKVMVEGVYKENDWRKEMEFVVNKITLLEEARKTLTRRITLQMQLESLTDDAVKFLNENFRANPGNTELCFHILQTYYEGSEVRLRSNGNRIALNDEFIDFVQSRDGWRYRVEMA